MHCYNNILAHLLRVTVNIFWKRQRAYYSSILYRYSLRRFFILKAKIIMERPFNFENTSDSSEVVINKTNSKYFETIFQIILIFIK